MKISMSLEPAQREVAENGSDDGNRVKKTSGHAPATRLVLLNLYIQSKLSPAVKDFPAGLFCHQTISREEIRLNRLLIFCYIG
jgi:hypothetical protein